MYLMNQVESSDPEHNVKLFHIPSAAKSRNVWIERIIMHDARRKEIQALESQAQNWPSKLSNKMINTNNMCPKANRGPAYCLV